MPKKHESKWNIEDLTDADIFAAIQYLDCDSLNGRKSESDGASENESCALAICLLLIGLLSGCLAFIWIYRWLS